MEDGEGSRAARYRERLGGRLVGPPEALLRCALCAASARPPAATPGACGHEVGLTEHALDTLNSVCDRFVEQLAEDVTLHKAQTSPEEGVRTSPAAAACSQLIRGDRCAKV